MAKNPGTALRDGIREIFHLVKLDKKDIYSVYYFAILGGLVQLILPVGIQSIINFVQAAQWSASVVVLIALVILGTFGYGMVQVRQMQLIEKVQQKIFLRTSFEFADRLPKINIQKMDDEYLPELTNRFFDTMSLQKGFGKLLIDIPAAIIQIFFGLLLLSFYHPVFIAFGIILTLLLALVLRLTAKDGMATSLEASKYKYRTAAWLQEMARAIKTFKYAKTSQLHLRENDVHTTGYLKSSTAHFKILLVQFWSLIGFKILITATLLIVGCFLMISQQLNIGQFVASEIIIVTIIASVEKLIVSFDNFYDVLVATQKLKVITDAEIEPSGTYELPLINKGVEAVLDNVTFDYAHLGPVLTGINVKVPEGEQLVIMGRSGAGKSSLLRLFTGAWQPQNGTVLIDKIPLKNYNLNSLRNNTGILLSQQAIFHGTLYENISMGNPNISVQHINELAGMLGLERFIHDSIQGYDTVLDTAGHRLSRIERQRILLLRALVGHHRLLLLEEPFRDLDKEQQQKVANFIKSESNSTVIITTANAEMAAQFSRIMLIDKGKQVAIGSWDEVKPYWK